MCVITYACCIHLQRQPGLCAGSWYGRPALPFSRESWLILIPAHRRQVHTLFPILHSEITFKLSFTNQLLSNILIIGSEPEGKIRDSRWMLFPSSPFVFSCFQYSFSSLQIEVIFLPMFSASMWQTFLFPVEQEPTRLPQACIRFVYPVNSFLDEVNSPEICSASPYSTCMSLLSFSTSCTNLRQSTGYFFFLINTI